MQLHAVKQLNVERELDDTTAPLPEALLDAANAVPTKPRYVSASDYADTVAVLRSKGFTWQEVTDWIVERGANFSMQSIIAGYRKSEARAHYECPNCHGWGVVIPEPPARTGNIEKAP